MITVAVIAVLSLNPIPQDSRYHLFVDNRTIFFTPNFFNVVSNLPFLLIGFLAVKKMVINQLVIVNEFKLVYWVFFAGVILVALGSGYYHLWPANHTLVWDRIPMTIVISSLLSIIIAEFISQKLAKLILLPLLILGVSSVIYWYIGEKAGDGDLRFYALAQFLPMLIIAIVLILFKSDFTDSRAYWWVLLCYLIAKLFEHFDEVVYSLSGLISGHSIKHLFAAFGLWLLLLSFSNRNYKSSDFKEVFD